MKKLSLIALGIAVLSCAANASIIPSLTSVTQVGASAYNWTYTASLSADQRLDPGATQNAICASGQKCSPTGLTPASGTFFTIYDFAGYNGTVTGPANWTAFTFLVGVTPSVEAGTPDNSAITNVSYFYNGPVVPTPGGPKPALGPTNLSNFVIGSSLNRQVAGFYTGQATKNTSDGSDGTLTQNFGSVNVPGGVPEPASMILIGSGLVGIAVFRRKLIRS